MKPILTVLSLSLVATSAFANNFEGSRQRSANSAESRAVARAWVTGAERLKATAFFVANEKREPLMLTARHVIGAAGPVSAACKQGIVHLEHSGLGRGKCVAILLEQGDFVLMRVDFGGQDVYSRANPLSILGRDARQGDAVTVIGYPMNRARALTVSDNCKVLPNSRVLQPADFTDKDFAAWKGARDEMKEQNAKTRAGYHTRDTKGKRSASFKGNSNQTDVINCTMYGGNSGGPVLVDGAVAGMPGGYYVKVTGTYPSDLGLPLAGFRGGFRKALAKHGVIIK